jgi:hypothetical protein
LKKNFTKIGLVERLKVKALSSSPRIKKKTKQTQKTKEPTPPKLTTNQRSRFSSIQKITFKKISMNLGIELMF